MIAWEEGTSSSIHHIKPPFVMLYPNDIQKASSSFVPIETTNCPPVRLDCETREFVLDGSLGQIFPVKDHIWDVIFLFASSSISSWAIFTDITLQVISLHSGLAHSHVSLFYTHFSELHSLQFTCCLLYLSFVMITKDTGTLTASPGISLLWYMLVPSPSDVNILAEDFCLQPWSEDAAGTKVLSLEACNISWPSLLSYWPGLSHYRLLQMSEVQCHFGLQKRNKIWTMLEGNTDMTIETIAFDWLWDFMKVSKGRCPREAA